MSAPSDFRKDFEILKSGEYIYFDNAATSQRPRQVLEAVTNFYNTANANPLRGLYDWSMAATDAYENARKAVADFIGADSTEEIIFTRNTTESLNLVAYSYGLENVHEGDEIVITVMEHHSNMLPWQMVAKKNGAKLVYMEPLCGKNIFESVIMYILDSAEKEGGIYDTGYDKGELIDYAYDVIEELGINEIEDFTSELQYAFDDVI